MNILKFATLVTSVTLTLGTGMASAADLNNPGAVKEMYRLEGSKMWACFEGNHSDYAHDGWDAGTATSILNITPSKDADDNYFANVKGSINGLSITQIIGFGGGGNFITLELGNSNDVTIALQIPSGISGDHEGGPPCEVSYAYPLALAYPKTAMQIVTCCLRKTPANSEAQTKGLRTLD